MHARVTVLAGLGLVLCTLAHPVVGASADDAVATFSVVGFDPETGDLGVAVQSRFFGVGTVVPYAQAGIGAIATQSYANVDYGPEGLGLLSAGASAPAALHRLTRGDAEARLRQAAIVDAAGRVAAFTGAGCNPWAGHIEGLHFSVQGNLLTGEPVVQAMAQAYRQARNIEDTELADWLMAALVAGQAAGGDKRGQQSAALLVVRHDGGYDGKNDRYVDLRVEDHPQPIEELARLYRIHREFYARAHRNRPPRPPGLQLRNLRCEYLTDPCVVDTRNPRLSWVLDSPERGQHQTAYQILVASTPEQLARGEGDLWDTGRVVSSDSTHVEYAGRALTSRADAHWKVRVWDRGGEASAWSEPARWKMGLLNPRDWEAHWIADAGSTRNADRPQDAGPLPATLFRREFEVIQPVRRAVAYVSALGLYELRLNGQRVGDRLLAPEWTSYRRRVQYQAYDVTGHLHAGRNAIAAMAAEGWYAGRLMVVGRFPYGDHPQLLLQLELELEDGKRQVIVTGDGWRSTTGGPIRAAGIYDGETYDARRELPGWDRAGFNDVDWAPVTSRQPDGPALVGQPNEPIRVTRELEPVAMSEPVPGVYVFDLGQNMVGWCRVRVAGRAGQTITLRHAEMLNDDGTLYTANLRAAAQVNRFTPAHDGAAVFEPRFTYQGFRYVEVTGVAAPPGRTDVVGRVFHSAAPEVGRFTCSDPALEQLMRNILWTQRGNLMSTPNDCPQRDERFGWMGDIQAFAQTAMFNMNLAAFWKKFLQDVRDDQASDGRFPDFAPHPGDPDAQFSGAPAWADAGVIVPWRAWQNYADRRLLAEHFEAARRWVDSVHRQNPDLIWSNRRGNDYNDWLNGDWIRQANWPSHGGSVTNELFATAFFAQSTALVAKMAEVLDRSEDAARYATLASRIRQAFNDRFVAEDGRLAGDTQTGYALALHFDLLPESLRPRAAAYLAEGIQRYGGHLSTGIQGTHRAMLELTRWGYTDVAWQLLTNRSFPSWLYMIDNGATTIWERWDGYVKGRGFQDAGMNSFNHWAFGAVGEWIWRHVVGLNPDEDQPGWRHFTVRPRPGGGVRHAAGDYDSLRGAISVAWSLQDARFNLRVAVPPGATATVWIPGTEVAQITEDGCPAAAAPGVRFLRTEDACALFEVESGTYIFEAPSP